MAGIDTPRIDKRNYQDLLNDTRSIIPLYTPEWNISDEKDTGFALLQIFTHMQEEIVNRLNRVPDKNFIAFLEMLGIKLIPAQPAKAPVTFYLPETLSGGVFVPARTQVATEKTKKHDVLTFETTNGLFATSAALKDIYCVDPRNDEIFSYSDDLENKKEFKLFTGNNLQGHVLYLGHEDLFKLEKPAEIKLQVELKSGSIEELKNMVWEYWGEDEEKPMMFTVPRENNTITLIKDKEGKIKKKEINGIESHWIHCRLESPIIIKLIKIENVTPYAEGIKPDLCFYNFNPLDCSQDFYPFGEQPRLYDTFYIASKEAFTKKNAKITIDFTIRNEPAPNNIELSWEYWDGTVWRRLEGITPLNENAIKDFSSAVTLQFLQFDCPDDFEEFEVNGEKNYWIRARLVSGDYGREEFRPKNPYLFSIDGKLESELEKTGTISSESGLRQAFKNYKVDLSNNATVKDKWMIIDDENIYYIKKEGDELKIYNEKVWIVTSNFKPPLISITIKYSFQNKGLENLQYCLAYNNLEFRDFTRECKESLPFKPFIPLPEKQPTLYLGFTDAFRKGNISIFFSLLEEIYHLDAGAKIQWTYRSTAPNLETAGSEKITLVSMEGMSIGTELFFHEPSDTETITGTGTIISISDHDITLDRELDHTYTKKARIFRKIHLEVTDNTEYLTKSETLEFIGPAEQAKTPNFGKKCFWLMGTFIQSKRNEPFIKGIYPNTVWAEQIETINGEILGSGDGEKDKSYTFIKSPVISPEIWVMEGEIISRDEKEGEKETLSKDDVREVKDDKGKIMETWVRWKAVDDFIDSDQRSRYCIIDHAMGSVQFGDGTKGMIPPRGKDNIRANYKSGGGVSGNIMKNEITVLKGPVAGIDSVINHEPAQGGSDTELVEEVLHRGPHVIKHRGRAVTEEDFERLAREASNYIARTKCSVEKSKVKIIIIPMGEEDKPLPSPGLIKIVRDHLLKRSLNSLHRGSLKVTGPSYVEVRVTVDVIPESIDDAIPLEKQIRKRLEQYFHPLTGGPEQRGWEFGRGVHISDVYAMLEGIQGVDHVENLKLNDESYLFSWDNIPGRDNGKLIGILKKNFGIDLGETAEIIKTDDNKTIHISNGNTSLTLRLNNENTKANLAIIERTYEFTAKMEKGELKIYYQFEDVNVEEFETVCSGEHRITMKLGS